MGLLDDLQGSFNRGVAATGRTARQVKLKSQMSDAMKRRQGLAAQLGANLYDATKDDPSWRTGREALYDGIAAIDAERAQIQAELDALEQEAQAEAYAAQVYTCPFCGSRVAATDMFCSGCGKPMAEIQAALTAQAPAPAPAAPASGTVCPNCGAPTNPGDAFCMNCGTRLDGAAAAPAAPAAEASAAEETPAVPQE